MMSFLNSAAGSLGVSEDKLGAATGGLLDMIKGQVSADDGSALMKALPGADKLPNGGGGGGLGGLMGAASGLLGSKGGAALGVLGIFEKAGLDAGQASSFMPMLMDFVTKNAGGDLVNRIIEQVPDLKGLLGK
jgi:hypothetical protein